MNHSSRREFLQTSGLLLSSAWLAPAFHALRYEPRLSFSTLGCPDWTFPQILEFAARHDYQGIELRGILQQMDLTQCREFSDPDNRSATLGMMKERKLKFVDLGSSAALHLADPVQRNKNLDEARKYIDLAEELNCPFIRVFPNSLPKDQERGATLELIITGLLELADHAKGSQVSVLIESHGDLVRTDDLEKVMESAAHPHAGMIWDVVNMWSITKEPPAEVYGRLKKYIRHAHIKDAKISGDQLRYVHLGQGDMPIFEAIDLLAKDQYSGYYSFEWEKRWHPEIGDSAEAIADYAEVMKKHFA